MPEIIYEEKDFLVAEKEPGISSQSDNLGEENMLSLLKDETKSDIYLVHRLDKNVGGVMVFAKTKKMAAYLSECIKEKVDFQKEYLAVVEGTPKEKDDLQDFLYKSGKDNKVYIVKKERRGVKKASLSYETLKTIETEKGPMSLVRVNLHTGRFHQIRAQFSNIGHALIGDGKYGSRINAKNIALWSHKLTFKSGEKGEMKEYVSNPPSEYPFNLFRV